MTKDTVYITLPPRHLRSLQGWDVIPAHLAYRIGPGPHLYRSDGTHPLRGGMMVLGDGDWDGSGPHETLCQEVLRECAARNFSGVVLDFERRLPPLEKLAARLDGLFARQGLALLVPEGYGMCAPNAKVMIPSSLSGGSLSLRLEEAGERFGRDRVVLALEKAAEDFFLPSPTGCGIPLTGEELEERMTRLRPAVFFSHELCARYFTYMSRDSGAHFVLFDDGETLRRKVDVAHRAGITTFAAPWAQVEEHASLLGLPRKKTH